jgi:hypothetical protein
MKTINLFDAIFGPLTGPSQLLRKAEARATLAFARPRNKAGFSWAQAEPAKVSASASTAAQLRLIDFIIFSSLVEKETR